ncbi:hypothetical protein [Pseudomonas sp. SST3]|uniref:hypothetical protein n=1 Tax=Pseudomonas sp. SST3 TaxID=2267882 RepID=UPI0014446C88|nr:hypothetical protein [Pseudomonas sp. SST3]NKQ09926.1 hypothetical protein [Pseudomonas sp. SST3]
MNQVQWIARNALPPLLFAALASPVLQGTSLSMALDLIGSDFAQRSSYATRTGQLPAPLLIIQQADGRLIVRSIKAATRLEHSCWIAATHTKRRSRSTAA